MTHEDLEVLMCSGDPMFRREVVAFLRRRDARAIVTLALYYMLRSDSLRDSLKAERLFRRSVVAGSGIGAHNLATSLLGNRGGRGRDEAEARKYYALARSLGVDMSPDLDDQ